MKGFLQLQRSVVARLRGLGPEYLDLYVAILAAVNYRPDEFQGVKIQPGQLVFSWRNIAERLYPKNTPSINTMRMRISRLEKARLIETKPIFKFDTTKPAGTLLSVSKFDTNPDTNSDTNPDTELRRGNKGKEIKDAQVEFDEFWKAYPSRNGRKLHRTEAEAAFRKIKPEDYLHLMQAVRNLSASDQLPKDAFRWLAKDRWREWLQAPSTNGHTQHSPPKQAERGRSLLDD
jgi:hypothetical protein